MSAILGIVIVVAFALWTAGVDLRARDGAVAEYKAKVAAAEAKAELAAKAQEAEAANHVADMESAYAAGEEKGRASAGKFQTRAAADVGRFPVFSNPACILPDDALALLNAARRAFRDPNAEPPPAAEVGNGPRELELNPAKSGGGKPAQDPAPAISGGAHPKPKPLPKGAP